MYGSPPKAMAELGLTMQDFVEPPLEVWPSLWPVVTLFAAAGSGAWVVGVSGPVGLRVEALDVYRKARCVPDEDWGAMLNDLSTLEVGALKAMR